MFKKFLNKLTLALKSTPRFFASLIRHLLKFVISACIFGLALALVLIGLGIAGAHTYLFLKTGNWIFAATPDIPLTQVLESEWIGAWKIFSWLPASLILVVLGLGVFFLYPKIKHWIHQKTGTEPSMPAPELVANGK
jgi:hypothetical protein